MIDATVYATMATTFYGAAAKAVARLSNLDEIKPIRYEAELLSGVPKQVSIHRRLGDANGFSGWVVAAYDETDGHLLGYLVG